MVFFIFLVFLVFLILVGGFHKSPQTPDPASRTWKEAKPETVPAFHLKLQMAPPIAYADMRAISVIINFRTNYINKICVSDSGMDKQLHCPDNKRYHKQLFNATSQLEAMLEKGNLVIAMVSSDAIHFNTLRPRQNGRRFADDTFKRIFLNKNVRISIKISLKFVPKGPINNIPSLVQIMAWRLSGDKPLSEPMMVSLPTHICVTRPQWVKIIDLREGQWKGQDTTGCHHHVFPFQAITFLVLSITTIVYTVGLLVVSAIGLDKAIADRDASSSKHSVSFIFNETVYYTSVSRPYNFLR